MDDFTAALMIKAVSDDIMMDDSFPGASMMIVSNTTEKRLLPIKWGQVGGRFESFL